MARWTIRNWSYASTGAILLVALSATGSDGGCEPARVDSDGARLQPLQQHMTALAVEVDVFSGMPNPRWTLSEADTAQLLSKVSSLQKTTARPRSGNLGYRGLIVSMRRESGRTIYVQNGVVELADERSSAFFLDPERSLERWLVETGKRHLSPEVLKTIEAALRK